MDAVRIGCVQYLNTLPLIEGLRTWKDCELVTAVPSKLIGMLRRGDVDVALASVIDAVGGEGLGREGQEGGQAGRPTILPVGMIGCNGPTLTVRLFSSVAIERLTRVCVDTDSHTSVTLMRVVLNRRFGIEPEVVEFDARERVVLASGVGGSDTKSYGGSPSAAQSGGTSPLGEDLWPEAVLLIGDKVVTDPPPEEKYPHQLDLGAAWKEMTGLPFVYAVWMCRGGEEGSVKVRAAAAMLERARLHNSTRMDWLVATRAGEKHWPRELAAKYLGEYLRFGVGEAEREAVGKFLGWAGELGLCGKGGVSWGE